MKDFDTIVAPLVAEYEAWLAVNPNVAPISADEALYELWADHPPESRSPEIQTQMAWLDDFVERWNAATNEC